MSEPLRVALVVEGGTDFEVINAALKVVLQGHDFIPTLLQPEPTRPAMGGGWCGVLKWCREFAGRGFPSLEEDPILLGFDLFVLHLDADVAGMKYEAGGAAVVEAAQGLLPLPCEEPCPPPSASAQALRSRLHSWLGVQQIGARTVLCIPSKAIESWFAVAVLPENHKLLSGIECNANLAAQLSALPKDQRIKKDVREYRNRAREFTEQWGRVVRTCTQAAQFAAEVSAALDAKVVIISPEPAAPVMTEVLPGISPEPVFQMVASADDAKPVALEVAVELMIAAEAAAPKTALLAEPASPMADAIAAASDPSDDPSTN